MNMIGLTPTERLEWLLGRRDLAHAHGAVGELLHRYELFLETTKASEDELIDRFMRKESSQRYMKAANEFGDLVFRALTLIGNGNRLHRVLVV
jgi:hypothetical protein